MDYRDRIVCNPAVMLGKPVIKGTRITVEHVLNRLGEGESMDDLLISLPHLQRLDLLAAISYSADVVSKEEMIVS